MGTKLTALVVFSVFCLLALRGYMSAAIRACQSKKEWKRYISNVSFIDHWFFGAAPKLVKDKYSKFEKKTIHYSSIVKAYRAINLVIHISLAIEFVFLFCHALGFVGDCMMDRICLAYFMIVLVSFVILAVIEFNTNSRYHRSRYRT